MDTCCVTRGSCNSCSHTAVAGASGTHPCSAPRSFGSKCRSRRQQTLCYPQDDLDIDRDRVLNVASFLLRALSRNRTAFFALRERRLTELDLKGVMSPHQAVHAEVDDFTFVRIDLSYVGNCYDEWYTTFPVTPITTVCRM